MKEAIIPGAWCLVKMDGDENARVAKKGYGKYHIGDVEVPDVEFWMRANEVQSLPAAVQEILDRMTDEIDSLTDQIDSLRFRHEAAKKAFYGS